MDRVRRALHAGPLVVTIGIGVAVIVGLAVLPARTWMSQRDAMDRTETELHLIEAEVAELDAQLRLLETDAEIERQARENYDLVYPGEESYRILPAPEE